MAMVKCDNCSKEISDKAKRCVHCGADREKIKMYCIECGTLLENGCEECSKCGCPVVSTPVNNSVVEKKDEIICPKCHSNDIKVQIVAQKEKRGCGSILCYLLLAVTIVGIPIVLLILLARGNKTNNYKYWVCQRCGNTFVPDISPKQNTWLITLCVIIGIFVFISIISMNGIESGAIEYPYVLVGEEMVNKEQYDVNEEIFCPSESLKIEKINYKTKVGNYVPDKGNIFAEVHISLINKTSYESNFYLSDFRLVTSNGEIINPLVSVNNNDLDVNRVISGGQYTGIVRFSIPKSQKEYEIRYDCGSQYINIKVTK